MPSSSTTDTSTLYLHDALPICVPIVGESPTALLAHQYLGASWYHSMQATFRQQVFHGLTSQVAYTFSKALANTTVYNDQRNLDLRSEEHTSELQSLRHLVCRLLLPPIPPLFTYTTLFRSAFLSLARALRPC